jgi:YQGE family putative transporter
MYWSAHHIYFLQSTTCENEGEKLGLSQSIPLLISIAGPFIGGVLIVNYSFREVFLFSTLLLVAASFSLFFSEDIKIKAEVTWKKVIDTKNFRKNTIFFLHGLGYCATSYVWPLLLFLSSINLIAMGFFYFLSNLVNAIIGYFGGKSADKNGTNKILKIGATGHSFSMIFRALSSTALFMATFQSMGGFFGGLMHIAIDTSFYKNAHSDIGNAIMNREFYMHLGRVTAILIFLLALYIFPLKLALILTLMVAGVFTFLLLLIVRGDDSFANISERNNLE